jgi:hypothetical protein
MFTKRATAPATLIAGFVGFVMGSLLVFGKIMQVDSLTVGVLWPATISFIITVALGYSLSYMLGRNTEESHNYTRANVMKNNNLNNNAPQAVETGNGEEHNENENDKSEV